MLDSENNIFKLPIKSEVDLVEQNGCAVKQAETLKAIKRVVMKTDPRDPRMGHFKYVLEQYDLDSSLAQILIESAHEEFTPMSELEPVMLLPQNKGKILYFHRIKE